MAAWTAAKPTTRPRTGGPAIQIGEGFRPWSPDPAAAAKEISGTIAILGDVPFIAPQAWHPIPPIERWLGDLLTRLWASAAKPAAPPARPGLLGVHRPPLARGAAPPPLRPTNVNPISSYEDGLAHLQGIARDWSEIRKFRRVNAYTFRGDRRNPTVLASAHGFHPSSTRTDDDFIKRSVFPKFRDYLQRRGTPLPADMDEQRFCGIVKGTLSKDVQRVLVDFLAWREIARSEEKHLGRMIADETTRAYVSTSRSIGVAKAFAVRGDGTGEAWVYATYVRGAFLIDDSHHWAVHHEAEIANPGSVYWSDVVGFRQVSLLDGKFDRDCPIYLRTSLERDADAFSKIYAAFAGDPWTGGAAPRPPSPTLAGEAHRWRAGVEPPSGAGAAGAAGGAGAPGLPGGSPLQPDSPGDQPFRPGFAGDAPPVPDRPGYAPPLPPRR